MEPPKIVVSIWFLDSCRKADSEVLICCSMNRIRDAGSFLQFHLPSLWW